MEMLISEAVIAGQVVQYLLERRHCRIIQATQSAVDGIAHIKNSEIITVNYPNQVFWMAKL
jgi:hypothetical protein